jgi:hypothetical protein
MAYNSMAEDRFDADDKWDLDPFEDDSSRKLLNANFKIKINCFNNVN